MADRDSMPGKPSSRHLERATTGEGTLEGQIQDRTEIPARGTEIVHQKGNGLQVAGELQGVPLNHLASRDVRRKGWGLMRLR